MVRPCRVDEVDMGRGVCQRSRGGLRPNIDDTEGGCWRGREWRWRQLGLAHLWRRRRMNWRRLCPVALGHSVDPNRLFRTQGQLELLFISFRQVGGVGFGESKNRVREGPVMGGKLYEIGRVVEL